MIQPEKALSIVSVKLEEAQHRAGVAKKLFMTSFYPTEDHEYAAMDAVMLLLSDVDNALRAARVALDGEPETDVPF